MNDMKKEYKQKYKDFKKGKISRKEWENYCMEILEQLMKENQEVLQRLKNC